MAKVVRSSLTRPRGPSWLKRRSTVARNTADTDALVAELAGAIARARFAHPAEQQRLTDAISHRVLGGRRYPDALRRAVKTCIATLVRNGLAPLYAPPQCQTTTPEAAFNTRSEVRQRLAYLQNENEAIAAWRRQLTTTLSQLARALPTANTGDGHQVISVPLLALLSDPVIAIDGLVRELTKLGRRFPQDEVWPGDRLDNRVRTNLLTVSRLPYEDAVKRPQRLTWPADAKLSPSELVDAYLTGTPFHTLLNTPVDLPIPVEARTEHAVYIATTGHGKTELLKTLLLRDLDDPDRPAIVIIDSQLDLIASASRLKQFDPALGGRRLIILDPTDILPIAFNPFSFDRTYAASLPARQRDAYLASVTRTFHFICAGLFRNELTPHMTTVFNFLVPWLARIEGATIHTLLSLLRDPADYWHHVADLPETTRTFLEELYAEKSPYRDTRQRIMQRVYTIISVSPFDKMFEANETKFNIRAALNDGSVVLISTDKPGIGEEYSAILGRFYIGQLLQSTMARAFIPETARRPAYIYVDEAHDYLDASVETMFVQARKYRVSLNIFTQKLSNLRDAGMLDTVLSLPAIRYVGAVSEPDANVLAREMRTTSEFLKSIGKIPRVSADWAVYVRNVTPSATKITVPFGQADRAPKMSPLAYQRLLMENRRAVGVAPQTAVSPDEPVSPTPINNDGESY